MSRSSRIFSCLAYAFLMSHFIGCATLHFPFEKKIPKASAADPVVQILCLWQPAEGRDPDGYPCRGFSGQILFLSSRAATPVQMEGDVRIYLFDDQGTAEEQEKPLRQFDFDNGSWDIHLTETSLGPTYHVFVPYVRRGTKDANCALRVRLKPKHGPTVFSDLSNMSLNANKKPVMGEDAKPITLEESDRLAAEAMSAKLRRTTTISMGSKPTTTESVTVAKGDAKSDHVQQASHEVLAESPKETAEADRIRRLETMVQQLLEQKSTPSTIPAPSNPTPRRVVDPLGLDDIQSDKSPSADRMTLIPRSSTATATAAQSNDDGGSEPTPPPRRKHPLDD